VTNPQNAGDGLKFRIAHFESRIWDGAVIRRTLNVIQIAILSLLILTTRCANYQDVFVAGNVYFTDADCYARMTRVRMCLEHPGLIVRHHAFENFPTGTTPHTTAAFDYLILTLSLFLRPFSAHAIDLAGALISPLLALLGGWFLWWWSRRMKFRYRGVMLILYAISPILVHGTELGRPDHQSLLILLVTIAICAEWSCAEAADTRLRRAATNRRRWSIVSGIAWGLAIWTSAYESLVLFLLVPVVSAFEDRKEILAKSRRIKWICFVLVMAIALLIERRAPAFSVLYSNPLFQNWARTIGELAHVSPANPIWLRWCGYLLLVTPFLIWISVIKTRHTGEKTTPTFVLVLLVATYALTIWQARWGYFFVLIFALALPHLLEPIKPRTAVWIAFCLSIFPILRDWDERLWPNEAQLADRVERRNESAQLRDLALSLRSSELHPFLAPWWLSPSIAYWSGQPGIAGSSHESLDGIADSARFFLSDDWQKADRILQNHRMAWVVAYDSERVAQNSGAILRQAARPRALCRVLDKTPAQAPRFLIFSAQNGTCKLYRTIAQ
jgi:heme exporter protein D